MTDPIWPSNLEFDRQLVLKERKNYIDFVTESGEVERRPRWSGRRFDTQQISITLTSQTMQNLFDSFYYGELGGGIKFFQKINPRTNTIGRWLFMGELIHENLGAEEDGNCNIMRTYMQFYIENNNG